MKKDLVRTRVIEVREALLTQESVEEIREELNIINKNVRTDVISSATTRLLGIINDCVNNAYQLGRSGK